MVDVQTNAQEPTLVTGGLGTVKATAPVSKPKTLDVVDPKSAKKAILDIKVWGDPDAWKVLSKASSESEGWMKSTKAMIVEGCGVLVQVSTQQINPDGSYSLAEALQFVPNAKVIEQKDEVSKNVINRTLRYM